MCTKNIDQSNTYVSQIYLAATAKYCVSFFTPYLWHNLTLMLFTQKLQYFFPHPVDMDVGLEFMLYEVQENFEMVEVCITLQTVPITCPIDFSFSVNLSITHGSAGIYYMYMYI